MAVVDLCASSVSGSSVTETTHWPPAFEAGPCGAWAWHAARTMRNMIASADERFMAPPKRRRRRDPGDYPALRSRGRPADVGQTSAQSPSVAERGPRLVT